MNQGIENAEIELMYTIRKKKIQAIQTGMDVYIWLEIISISCDSHLIIPTPISLLTS